MLTAVLMKSQVFWGVIPCPPINCHGRFVGKWGLRNVTRRQGLNNAHPRRHNTSTHKRVYCRLLHRSPSQYPVTTPQCAVSFTTQKMESRREGSIPIHTNLVLRLLVLRPLAEITSLLNFCSPIFGLTPFDWLYYITLTPYF